MGEGNKRLSKRDAGSGLRGVRRARLPARRAAQLPRPARLGDRRGPRRVHHGRDGRGLRHPPGQPQPRALRPQEARGDQRRPHAAARASRSSSERLLPFLHEADLVEDPPTPGRDAQAHRGQRADPRARRHPRRGRRHAGVPVPRRRRLRRGRRRQGARRRRARRSWPPPARRSPPLADWTTAAIEEALRAKLVDELGLKPRNAFGPVRVAVTGRRVSPPLFESLELLGREQSLARLDAAPAAAARGSRG